MRALPDWTELVAAETTNVLVNFVSMSMPTYRGGAVTHGMVRNALKGHLARPAANVATRFLNTASQGDLLPCHTLLVETGTSLRLEVYAKMSLPRTWIAQATAVIRRYSCGTYAVGQNGQVAGGRVIWVEFPK